MPAQFEMSADGTEGLDQYRRERPDAVLMDINMPKLDGVACIEEILKLDPKPTLRFFQATNCENL